MRFDYLLVGGGLQNGLIALALLARRPGTRIALLEQKDTLGGNHLWCFHADDLEEGARTFVNPLIRYRWPGYRVSFPGLSRELASPYAGVSSEHFDAVVRTRLASSPGCQLFLGVSAQKVSAREVTLADGRTLRGALVIDARGPERQQPREAGYQKFLGLEVALERPHGLLRPHLMDATVPQRDGFRFLYTLPLSPTRLLVEDTCFSDTPHLAIEQLRQGVLSYAASRGWAVGAVLREERGVLPLPWREPRRPCWTEPLLAGYQGGWFHPVTGYSFPLAARLADHLARKPPEQNPGESLRRLIEETRRQLRYGLLLNRMLFSWFPPEERYRVLERFYMLPEETIRRFYALRLTRLDQLRILAGRPPRGISLRAVFLGRRTG